MHPRRSRTSASRVPAPLLTRQGYTDAAAIVTPRRTGLRGEILQPAADRAAIGLSMLCAAHCLLLPIALVSPSVAALGLDDSSFHLWMLFVVVPVSAYALYVGVNRHRSRSILAVGILGILVLSAGALLGHDGLGETGEKMVTLLGVALVAACHLRNVKASQRAAGKCAGDDSRGVT